MSTAAFTHRNRKINCYPQSQKVYIVTHRQREIKPFINGQKTPIQRNRDQTKTATKFSYSYPGLHCSTSSGLFATSSTPVGDTSFPFISIFTAAATVNGLSNSHDDDDASAAGLDDLHNPFASNNSANDAFLFLDNDDGATASGLNKSHDDDDDDGATAFGLSNLHDNDDSDTGAGTIGVKNATRAPLLNRALSDAPDGCVADGSSPFECFSRIFIPLITATPKLKLTSYFIAIF